MQACKGAPNLWYRWRGTAWDCAVTVVIFHEETVAGAVVLGTCEPSTWIALERMLSSRSSAAGGTWCLFLGLGLMVASPVGDVFSLRY